MNKKRALVISGGGSKGSFEVGILKHLMGDKEIQYDIITGISVGAINASFLAQYPQGKEIECIEALEELWFDLGTKDVYHNHRPFGKAEALWKPSVFDSSPLKKLIYKKLDPEAIRTSGKQLRISAASLHTGNIKVWDENDSRQIKDAVLASSAFPVMLTPIEIDGELYTDAGVKDIAPLNTAIKAGAEIIDIIVTSPLGSQLWKPKRKTPNAIEVLLRSIELMSDEILANDLIRLEKVNQSVCDGSAKEHHRFIEYNLYQPTKVLTSNSLDFSHDLLMKMKMEGYKLALSKD